MFKNENTYQDVGPGVAIYGRPNCPWCDRAKELAEANGLEYTYYDVMSSTDIQADFKQQFPNATTVPQIVWDGIWVGGHDDFKTKLTERTKL